MEQVTLHYSQGSSDKVYQASIERRNGGFVVNYTYGRRGTTLQAGTKTETPVPYESARKLLDKLVQAKTAKGYTPGEYGTPYQHTANGDRASGINCQLLNPIDEATAHRLVQDPAFCLQEKLDGRRLLIRKTGEEVRGINRLGLFVGIPGPIAATAAQLRDCVVDGEAVGDILHAFDLLEVDGVDLRALSYRERYQRLAGLGVSGGITVVATATTAGEKALAFCTHKAMNAEGVVFKDLAAPYTPGRSATGGSQLKFKFCETASFIVGAINQKRSVSLMLFRGDQLVPAGNVTIPPNQNGPVAGAVVECRYLYAFRESGAVFQPVYLARRDDIVPTECVVEQLKYKEAS